MFLFCYYFVVIITLKRFRHPAQDRGSFSSLKMPGEWPACPGSVPKVVTGMRSSLSDATARASLGDAPARKRASGIHCVDYGETAPSMAGAKGEKPVTRSEAEIRDRAWGLGVCLTAVKQTPHTVPFT